MDLEQNIREVNDDKEAREIKDEVIEQIYRDIRELQIEIERNRAVTELTQELVMGLKKEIRDLIAKLGLEDNKND